MKEMLDDDDQRLTGAELCLLYLTRTGVIPVVHKTNYVPWNVPDNRIIVGERVVLHPR